MKESVKYSQLVDLEPHAVHKQFKCNSLLELYDITNGEAEGNTTDYLSYELPEKFIEWQRSTLYPTFCPQKNGEMLHEQPICDVYFMYSFTPISQNIIKCDMSGHR